MCGITGIFNINKKKINKDLFELFNNTLIHRGPDGGDIYINDERCLGLGHRRLSILDLSENGKQPMSYLNSKYWITFNGEIFNFIELRNELKQYGYVFKSDCDTEVIMAAYDYWGKDCLEKFNGMWAFALWDTDKKKLFLARDRFGIKPLYYLYLPRKVFAFSSETISFKEFDGFEREVDKNNLTLVLQNPFVLEGFGKTIFKDIRQIMPGHWIELDAVGNLSEQRWWTTAKHLQVVDINYENQANKFREMFEDSCRLRLRSDVPLATALSGGVDSTAVYCMLYRIMNSNISRERMTNNWQQAFVATFPDSNIDETEYAKKVVEFVKGRALYVKPDYSNLVDKLIESTVKFDSVYLSPIFVAGEVYKSMHEHGLKISLDGHGVDEMLFGYNDMVASAYYNALNRGDKESAQEFLDIYLQMQMPGNLASAQMSISKKSSIGSLLAIRLAIKFPWLRTANSLLTKRQRYPWLEKPLSENLNLSASEFSQTDSVGNIAYNIFHKTTLPTILRNFDRASMQYGIEIRMPFMDWRLVSYVFSLPLKSKLGGGYTKRILRDSLKGIMPEDIRTRKLKIGLNAPLVDWFPGVLKNYVLETVNSRNFLTSNIWKGKMIRDFTEVKMRDKSWTASEVTNLWLYLNAFIVIDK